jgi:outer membrane protein assembly factor BamB
MLFSRPLMIVVTLTCFLSQAVSAGDWPQWRGPERDGVWIDSGITDEIPKSGLPVKWRVPVGLGYAGPAVADGKVFVADYHKTFGEIKNSPGGTTELTGEERLRCFDVTNGKELWSVEYDQPYKLSYAAGPRCTPTVDGSRVYLLGAEGRLGCYQTSDGKEVWSKSLNEEYNTKSPFWGHSAHPLVHGDLLICVVGGKGSVAVAFNKTTGKEVWRALDAPEQGYCPPTIIKHAGVEQLLIWSPVSLNALNPNSGDLYWSLPLQPQYGMSVTMPIKEGNNLFASAIGAVGALIELDDSKPEAKIVWKGNTKSALYSCNSTPFMEDGMIYGCDINTGALIGANLKDGKRLWSTTAPTNGNPRGDRHATAYLVKQGKHFWLFSETGDLILANLSRKGYEELGRFHVLEPTNEAFGRQVVWSHPAFGEHSLFARNDKELVRVDLSAK